jgi:hypothetical protein
MVEVRWCCQGFNTNFLNAGNQGVGVFAAVFPGETRASYVMQFRALDPDAPPPEDVESIWTVFQVGLRFCPWCGRNLRKWYLRTSTLLLRNELLLTG